MKPAYSMAIAGTLLCLCPLSAIAQTAPPRTDPSAPTRPAPVQQGTSTRPSDGTAARATMDGEVTKVDAKKGWVDVKTSDGRMKLHFPSSALENVKTGDRVTVEMGMSRVAGAQK